MRMDCLGFGRSFHAYEKLENYYRAKGDNKSVIIYTSLIGDWLTVARLAEKEEDYLTAGQAWERISQWVFAAHCFEKGGLYDEAAQAYLSARLEINSANAYKFAGDNRSYGQLLLKFGKTEEAIKAFRRWQLL